MRVFLLLLCFFVYQSSAMAGVYKCMVNGKLVFSDNACVTGAEQVKIEPPPRDSLDHPEGAEAYRKKQELELHRQRVELEEKARKLELATQRREDESKRRQMEMLKDLEKKATDSSPTNDLGLPISQDEVRRRQDNAIKALRAIKGIPDPDIPR